MNDMIKNFIDRNRNHKGFEQYLEKSFSPILKDYYAQANTNIYKELQQKESRQKVLHRLMEQECIELFKFCNQSKIPIIGLKGIFLEKQFWNLPRFYNDIDVIVDPNEICNLYNYFAKKNSYRVIKKRSLNPFQKYLKLSSILTVNLNKTHHIVLWNENENIKSNGIDHIEIEIHGNFDTFNIANMNRAILFNETTHFGEFTVLNNESQILFLIYHTIQHLPYVRHNLRESFIKFDRFIDVANIITKSKIDWEKFVHLSTVNSLDPLCSLYFKLFNEIFPNLIPHTILLRINANAIKSQFYWNKIYFRLMHMDPIDLIIGNLEGFPELERPYLFIKNHILGDHYNNPYITKFAMELWKFKLISINHHL